MIKVQIGSYLEVKKQNETFPKDVDLPNQGVVIAVCDISRYCYSCLNCANCFFLDVILLDLSIFIKSCSQLSYYSKDSTKHINYSRPS